MDSPVPTHLLTRRRPHHLRHGHRHLRPRRSHEEFALLAASGIPPDQVLRAATLNAAIALGRGDSLGSIAPGKLADIIAMKLDPLTHIDQLSETGKVTFVMKEGQVFTSKP